MTKPQIVVVVSLGLWGLLWLWPFGVFLVGLGIGIGLVGLVGWSALRYRAPGWGGGLVLALLLLTLPVWVPALARLYEHRAP